MKDYKYKISIIVPVYNVERYIDKCVSSIVNQSYKNTEIILVDDGSLDESIHICKEYAKLDNRIKIITQENGGASKARNTGIEASTGDYIIFIDSDDYWDNEYALEIIMNNIEESDADILKFGVKKFIEKDNSIEKYRKSFNRECIDFNSKKISIHYLAKNNLLTSSPWNKIIKRKLLTENNLIFIEGITSEDIDWNARLIIFGERFDILEEDIYVYRQREDSISHLVSEKTIEQLFLNIKKCIEYVDIYNVKDTDFYEEYMTYVAYQYMTLLVNINSSKVILEKNFLTEVKSYRYLLMYDLNYRVKIFNRINKYCGFYMLNKFIKLYTLIKKGS